MRYKINGAEIRSENAAKPACDAASYLVTWLHNREKTHTALDFGCGKLRYTEHLAQRSKIIGLVDSKVQIERTQLIDGANTSIQDHVPLKWPQWRIHILESFLNNPSHRYNFILCANVLSAIPCPRVRAKSLRAIHSALYSNGRVLFVNQHVNSYFTEIRKKPSTRPHLDGWIAHSRGRASYYGILNKNAVTNLISRYGFSVERSWVKGQSNYVVASKEKR